MEYFAQDEATRLTPTLTVYETLEAGSPNTAGAPAAPAPWGGMVPAIRTILGGFLFSGDDVYKKVGVLSGGERTRLAVARMLLRPSNTLLLDEPTNHLDLDSKDVLLDALEDYGGTLIMVSHDRYFVERLATKIIEIGHGDAIAYPGRYAEFLWSKEHQGDRAAPPDAQPSKARPPAPKTAAHASTANSPGTRAQAPTGNAHTTTVRKDGSPAPPLSRDNSLAREERKRADAERKKSQRAAQALQKRIADLEARIAEREKQVKELEAAMAAPGFYESHETSKPVIDRHQALMWEVGDLMAQWESLQEHAASES
jgi:ATP-binding cassette subfamily F protein 3